jgi:cobalt-precorrin 5A hydrolase
LGGANALTRFLASILEAQPVITTAADVNETIAVDLVGRELGWTIENFQNVTKVSAMMVNEESIGIYQDAGEKKEWWPAHMKELPRNVFMVQNIEEIKSPRFKGALVISDRIISDPEIVGKSVIYRPRSLVVGIGLHWDTTRETIETGITTTFREIGLSFQSIRNISSLNRGAKVKGLEDFSQKYKIPVELYDKEKLASISVPNPSTTVQRFEGTPSVSEASSIISSKGELIVPKQKFPPNLTIAISRITYA